MKGDAIRNGKSLAFPFLLGLIVVTTSCFTIVTDDAGPPDQSTNPGSQSSEVAEPSPVTETQSSDSVSNTTYELELIVEPDDAAKIVVTPKPDEQGAYLAGTTVTIDVLLSPGWEIEQWVGPVDAISNEVAIINMGQDQTVLVRMVQTDPILVPAGKSQPVPTGPP